MIDPATGQQLVAAPMMAHAHGQAVFQVTEASFSLLIILPDADRHVKVCCPMLISVYSKLFRILSVFLSICLFIKAFLNFSQASR